MSLQLTPIHLLHHHHRGRYQCGHQQYQVCSSVRLRVSSTSPHPNRLFISLLPKCHLSKGKGRIAVEGSVGSLSLFSEKRRRRSSTSHSRYGDIVASSSVGAPLSDGWKPEKGFASPPLSDILWPSAGAFAAMAILGKMDQILAPKGLSMTIAPLGAVCAVLFATPASPAARKYNVFMAQIGCAAIGVLAFSLFGPGWLARSTALAACIAFMISTGSTHPPAASLPILFIDGAKLHHLNFWYALFPGATGCVLICLIQEIVGYFKASFKF